MSEKCSQGSPCFCVPQSDLFCIAFCYLFHETAALPVSIKYIPKQRGKCIIKDGGSKGEAFGLVSFVMRCFLVLLLCLQVFPVPWGSINQILFG